MEGEEEKKIVEEQHEKEEEEQEKEKEKQEKEKEEEKDDEEKAEKQKVQILYYRSSYRGVEESPGTIYVIHCRFLLWW